MSDKPTNCPNCGAPLKGGKCEYCGTTNNDVDSEIARLELEKQSIMNQMENQRQTTLMMSLLNGIYKPFPP
jgi:uncharacterized Zn finger protein (UPF0148 family)